MKYIALLRGINVGGNNKVPMAELKKVFEAQGMLSVHTYINTGNVLFECDQEDIPTLASQLKTAIDDYLNLNIPVLILTQKRFQSIVEQIPDAWENDADQKSNVLFLFAENDQPTIMESLPIKAEYDNVQYVSGAILWNTKKKTLTKSGLMKLASLKIYKSMTVRNVNTARKISDLCAVN